MLTNEEMQLMIHDLNEGVKREGLQNAAHRLTIVGKLQAMAQQQARVKKAEEPKAETVPNRAARRAAKST